MFAIHGIYRALARMLLAFSRPARVRYFRAHDQRPAVAQCHGVVSQGYAPGRSLQSLCAAWEGSEVVLVPSRIMRASLTGIQRMELKSGQHRSLTAALTFGCEAVRVAPGVGLLGVGIAQCAQTLTSFPHLQS